MKYESRSLQANLGRSETRKLIVKFGGFSPEQNNPGYDPNNRIKIITTKLKFVRIIIDVVIKMNTHHNNNQSTGDT